ncbi:hypothetical protein [Methylogaea oryzae]|uniref:hypothetical protein n=1 Tax=Methylogaea oryzae TaxID=1295382 RepID=UPI0020D0BB1A|nr:hypothetical protein [Methylogaea oryzae]
MRQRRVVVTGVGIVSSIGHGYAEVVANLKQGNSGLCAMPQWRELGFPSTVAGNLGDVAGKIASSGIKKASWPMPRTAPFSAFWPPRTRWTTLA